MSQQPAPYNYVNPDAFLQRHQEAMQERQESGQQFWKLKSAPFGAPRPHRNEFRIMPPHPNMGQTPIIRMKVHFSLGPNQNVAAPCVEPYGKPCPACEWVDSLFGRGRAEMDPVRAQQYKDIAFKQRAGMRYFINIVDIAEPHRGVQPWAFGNDVYDFVAGCFYDDSNPPKFRDITHPETGRNILVDVIKKKGRFEGREINDYPLFRPKDRDEPLFNMDLLYQVADLTDYVYEPSTDEVVGALQGKRIDRTSRAARLAAGTAPAALNPAPPSAPAPPAAPPAPALAPPVVRTPMAPAAPPVAPAPPVARAPMPVAPSPAPPAAPAPAVAPPVAPAPPVAAPPAPPAAPPAPAPRGRRAAAAAPPAPSPAPPVAPAPAPPVASAPPMAPTPAPPVAPPRQPMAPAAAPAGNGADPHAAARAEINRMIDGGLVKLLADGSRFVPHEPSKEEVDDAPRIPCYLRETDPADGSCQMCAAILPCLAGRMAGVPGSVPWTFPR